MNTVHAARTMAGVWVLVAITLLTLHQATAAPTVNAPWGRIQGRDSVSVSGMKYSAYLAIPFARPPVGELRFAKPVAHPGLEDGEVFNATTLGDQCLQLPGFSSDLVGMSEDCLTLNVYVPASTSVGLKSVMVWIYGGAFVTGGAPTYTPSELVTENDVIVVIIQYRLDALGFLSSGDDTVPGNFGLWDQNLALRWVKTNIAAFGGDPESMTVFGESAGAVSVGFQMLSPVSKGLSFRAILQSGTPLAPWTINRNPGRAFDVLANETGCLDGSLRRRRGRSRYFIPAALKKAETEEVLACLRGLDASELIREVPQQLLEGTSFITMLVWVPVVDGEFVPANPVQLMSNVTYLDDVGVTQRDVMLGVTNDEGAGFVALDDFFSDIRSSTEGRSELIRGVIEEHLIFLFGEDLEKEPQTMETLVNTLEFFYVQWSNNGAGTVSLQNVADPISDIAFVMNTVMFVRDLAKAKAETSSQGRHYLYLFNHFPAFKAGLPELRGIYHAEDLAYEFDPVSELGDRLGFTDVENAIGTIFRTTLASFAETGQPVVFLLDETSGVITWPEYTLSGEEYLSLERTPRVDNRLFGSRVALWTHLAPSVISSTQDAKPTRYRIC